MTNGEATPLPEAVEAAEAQRRKEDVLKQSQARDWLQSVEPAAKLFFEITNDMEKAVGLSMAISLMRIADNGTPVSEKPPEVRDDPNAISAEDTSSYARKKRQLRAKVAKRARERIAAARDKGKDRVDKTRDRITERVSGAKVKAKADIKARRK
jgi:hypothetical protein